MRPFKEVMNPITGCKDRIPWDAAKARAKMLEIRQKHKDRLNAEDCERAKEIGIAKMIDENHGMLGTIELKLEGAPGTDGDESVIGSGGQYVVNPLAMQIKHSGAALNDAFIPEWEQFCSTPQNDDNVEYPSSVYTPKEGRRSPTLSADVPIASSARPERRGPGRPRKALIGSV